MKPRIAIVSNTTWNIVNFRMNLARTLTDEGFEVHAVGTDDGYAGAVRDAGYHWHEWKSERRSLNPFAELIAINRLRKVYKAISPDIVHHYTIKPVLYGTIAARLARVPGIVNGVTGLPHSVMSQPGRGLRGFARSASLKWYAGSLAGKNIRPIFQNEDDLAELAALRPAIRQHAVVTSGSGIDLSRFRVRDPASLPGETPTVTFVGRLIREKGINEFVDAVRLLKQRMPGNIRFIACGQADFGNLSSVAPDLLDAWKQDGSIDFRGQVSDIREILAETDLVVLPSYREGTPRSLLEAAASGLPIVTTDVPGCREVVVHDENGILIPSQDPAALADAIAALIGDTARLRRYGVNSRKRAEERFDERVVISRTLTVYRTLLADEHQAPIQLV